VGLVYGKGDTKFVDEEEEDLKRKRRWRRRLV
jgi:hypothetical protein